jgi:predicted Rossmann fold flavoprotein
VDLRMRCKVTSIEKNNATGLFHVVVQEKDNQQERSTSDRIESSQTYDAVILATGSAPIGYQLAQSLGHAIVPTVASLFTLSTKHAIKEDGLLHGLFGVSVPRAMVSINVESESKQKKTLVRQEGPLLITHHGLSGPAALRLSAFGAREFAAAGYKGKLHVHWCPSLGSRDSVFESLWKQSLLHPKKLVTSACPLLSIDNESQSSSATIPRRLWSALATHAGIAKDTRWSEVSKKNIRALAGYVAECELEMTSKGSFKEEFVTAGGVDLKEIDMQTMQSKASDSLFLCGELINVDGVTGGFNFMNCW